MDNHKIYVTQSAIISLVAICSLLLNFNIQTTLLICLVLLPLTQFLSHFISDRFSTYIIGALFIILFFALIYVVKKSNLSTKTYEGHASSQKQQELRPALPQTQQLPIPSDAPGVIKQNNPPPNTNAAQKKNSPAEIKPSMIRPLSEEQKEAIEKINSIPTEVMVPKSNINKFNDPVYRAKADLFKLKDAIRSGNCPDYKVLRESISNHIDIPDDIRTMEKSLDCD